MHIAIIGAGLVGRLLAWRLLQREPNAHISLFDQHGRDHLGTGLVAAAMVAPFTEAISTDAITQTVGEASQRLWANWLPTLSAQAQCAVPYNQNGTVVVAHPQDEPTWQRFLHKANALFATDVKPKIAPEQMQILNAQALNTLEPELTPRFKQALYFANESVIDNHALYDAFAQLFDVSDAIDWHEQQNIRLDCDAAQYGTIAESNITFDWVFDCRGNDAKAELKQLRSVRGELAKVYAPEVSLSRAVRLLHPRYPLYLSPRDNHHYVIGATQIESADDSPVTVRSGLELLSALYTLHPGFAEANIVSFLTGLRPSFPSNLPQVRIRNRLVHINGMYRHGYLFSPAVVEDTLATLFGEPDTVRFPQLIQTSHTKRCTA